MMSNTWKVLSLLGVLLGATTLASCYGSNGQTKDGQSHWLETCSTSDDCGGGALCVCGVCTIECGSTAACGASSTCEPVDDRQACSDAPSGVSRVCLASCDDDDDCDASSLTCVADSCVGNPVSILPDGEIPNEDAGSVQDASVDPTKAQTVEGPLTCDELHQRRTEVLSALANDHRSCETERDCVCASTGTNCAYECNQSLSMLAIEEFHQSVMDFNLDYCLDASARGICSVSDPECGTCRAICVAGECTSTTREGCNITGLVCPGDQVCHIDLNCIERGVADDNGVATLAIAQELYFNQSNPEFMGILALLVTSEAVYWFDSGTFDGELFNDDAALYRMAHDDDTPELLASGLAFATSGLASDGTSLYYSGPDGIWSIPLAGGVEPTRLVEYESVFGMSWLLHDGFIYYVNPANRFVHRVRTDGTGDELFWDNDKTVYELTASGDTVYVEVRGEDGESSLFGFTAPNSAAVMEQIPFRNDADRGRLLAVDDQLLSDLGNSRKGLQIFELSNASSRVIAEEAWLDLRSVSDGYVYSLETTVASKPKLGEYYITRTSIADGTSERLRRAVGPVGQIGIGGGYLYWVEDLRLMRKSL